MVKKLIHIIFVVSVIICVAACEEPMDSGVWNDMEEVMQTGLPVVGKYQHPIKQPFRKMCGWEIMN